MLAGALLVGLGALAFAQIADRAGSIINRERLYHRLAKGFMPEEESDGKNESADEGRAIG